jgi:hypothetical protein
MLLSRSKCVTVFAIALTVAVGIGKADEYAEAPSTVAYNHGYLNAWGEVIGSILPAGDTDPVCNEINAICRRVCADLPPGESIGSISEVGISPPGYARGVGNPEVFHNQVWRVCRRVKNWGTGTRKTFAFQVVYAPRRQDAKLSCEALMPTATAPSTTEAADDPNCGTIAEALAGAGLLQFSQVNPVKLAVARADAVSKSKAVDPDSSNEINANDQLPNRARLTRTRYQVSVPGSGWLECDAASGQCPIPSATWLNRGAGAGTLRNAGKEFVIGRVILEFIEIEDLDFERMYQPSPR